MLARGSRTLGRMTEKSKHKKVLLIGGHGKVGLLAIPKLVEEGHEVTGLIRDPGQSADIAALGAIPVVKDVTEFSSLEWEQLISRFDVVVWAAGNGGKAGPEVTVAVDRDAAAASVDAAMRLGDKAPRYLMVSFVGSLYLELDPENALYVYAGAKREVDEKLLATRELDYLILAPCLLTTDPAEGAEVIANDPGSAFEDTTARDLVADVIVEMTRRERLPADKILAFRDGSTPVWEL